MLPIGGFNVATIERRRERWSVRWTETQNGARSWKRVTCLTEAEAHHLKKEIERDIRAVGRWRRARVLGRSLPPIDPGAVDEALQQRPGPGAVYLISDGSYVKIGYSEKPEKRFVKLQAATPYTLALVGLAHSASVKGERALHRVCAEYHIRGEWYAASVVGFLLEAESFEAVP